MLLTTNTSLVLVAIYVLAASASPAQIVPMTNNECGGVVALSPGVNPGAPAGLSGHVYTSVGATNSTGVPLSGFCSQFFFPDVWFYYQASVSGTTTISTCTPAGFAPGSLVDTFMVVQTINCASPFAVGCNNDTCGSLASVTFTATEGLPYNVRIGGLASVGTFYVVVTPPPAPPNDECSGAIALAVGPNGPYSNVTATSSVAAASCGFGGSPGYRDLWFSLTTCGAFTIDTCSGPGAFDTILQVYDACGGVELACNDDTGGPCGLGSTVGLTATTTTTYIVRVSAFSSFGTASIPINVTLVPPPTSVAWSSPLGPGSIRADLSGPQNGAYFLAITGVAGTYPSGWLFGLDISYAELAVELAAGFPFTGPLGPCGTFAFGPIPGLPPGLTIYSLALGFLPGAVVPSTHSPAIAYTIP